MIGNIKEISNYFKKVVNNNLEEALLPEERTNDHINFMLKYIQREENISNFEEIMSEYNLNKDDIKKYEKNGLNSFLLELSVQYSILNKCYAHKNYDELCDKFPHVAPYILTNAHQRHVLVRTNVRELYHMSRLREDAHAQWDIRRKTALMSEKAKKVMPLSCMLIGGKDVFADTYKDVYSSPIGL